MAVNLEQELKQAKDAITLLKIRKQQLEEDVKRITEDRQILITASEQQEQRIKKLEEKISELEMDLEARNDY